MGKKIHPHSLRIGITRTWDSKWYAKRDFKAKLLQDMALRKYLKEKCQKAGISKIEILRKTKHINVIIHSPKPGMIVGRGGELIGALQTDLANKFNETFELAVQEIRKPDADAQLVADSVAEQISKRFPYRRVIKMAINKGKEANVKGIKIMASGRLNGVDIARSESYSHGTVPLHTLRADIEYAISRADTMYGVIGIKVWVYHGLVFKNKALNSQ